MFSNHCYQIQDINYVQHKNVNMSWDYWRFPRHQVAAENIEIRGRQNLLLCCNYSVDPKLGKVVCAIRLIPCTCPVYVAQLDKYWLPNIGPSSQPRYAHVENC